MIIVVPVILIVNLVIMVPVKISMVRVTPSMVKPIVVVARKKNPEKLTTNLKDCRSNQMKRKQ